MKVLETVLSFFLTLAQVIFPRKRKRKLPILGHPFLDGRQQAPV